MNERAATLEGDGARSASTGGSGTAHAYRQARIAHWNALALRLESWRGAGGAYRRQLAAIYRTLIPAGRRVLEIGCGEGDLLAALAPAEAVGVDFSPAMLERARRRHPQIRFVEADAHDLSGIDGKFDYIVLSDLLHDCWDVQDVLAQSLRFARPDTRFVINLYSRLWSPLLRAAELLRLKRPNLEQNWLTVADVENLCRLAGLSVVRSWRDILLPLPLPLVAAFANRYLAKIWPLSHLSLANFVVARPAPKAATGPAPRVSVVVPARNEAGNIAAILARTPELGAGTELIFVEGNSTDSTWETIERALAAQPERCALLLRQPGRGKGDAVRTGFARATGDILMILDADLTVPPESLPRFLDAIVSGQGEFVNGVRLVYPMEARAMQFANLVANKSFGLAFSYLLGQPIKDTLCGTKVLTRSAYDAIASNRSYFGEFDPFGDFDLLFGAARLNLRIVDMPIRYHERTYGTTNIQRWRHGVLLLRMMLYAANKLKFV